MKKINYFLIIIFLLGCANPIEKKKRQLKNLKVQISEVSIHKYNIILIPPLPKIYFDVFLEVENTNEESVTLQRFSFKILKNYTNQENILIASAKTSQVYELQAGETKRIKLELVTNLEENKDRTYSFIADILKALIKNEEIEFLLDGYVEYDTFLGTIKLPVSQIFKTKARI